MGIPGLTTFIENSFSGKWLQCEPKGHLVIDGHSLCFTMHFDFHIDWIHGGQYWKFKELLLKFFHSLLSSDIVPVLVFDGIDYKREKEPVIMRRKRDSVRAIRKQLTEHGAHSCPVLPVLAIEVFRQVLEELNIRMYIADGEADPHTVAIANHYKCPVVSNDSDYYIFNVHHGYIPLKHLNWQNKPVKAEMYTLNHFNAVFGLKDPKLSRMIPAIVGNDFIEGRFDNAYLKEDIMFSSRHDTKGSYRVESILRYIAKFKTVSELLEHVSTLETGHSLAKSLTRNLEKAEQIYNIDYTLSQEDLMNNSILVTTNGSKIPDWVLKQYRCGYFVSSLMETLVVGQSFLRIATDDPYRPSAQLASRPIRQSIYSILSPLMKGNSVSEIIRFEADLHREQVDFSSSITFSIFPAIQELSPPQRTEVLCEVIGVSPTVLEVFDRKWKLVVASACFWVRECSPNLHLVKSLVLCFLFCSQDRDPGSLLPRGNVHEERNSKWMNALHQFSCFQCIYLDMMKLNNILLNPLLFVSPAYLFDGRLAQFYACKKDINGIVDKNFKESLLYKNLFETLTSFGRRKSSDRRPSSSPKANRSKSDAGHQKPKVAAAKKVSGVMSNNPFAMLTLEDDEEEASSDKSDE